MQIILLERVEKLGQMGDVVKVKDGFARNFLLPRRKALRATKENIEHFAQQKAVLEAQNLKRRGEAEAVAAKMDNVSVTLLRQAGESGQLYGSVNARDIADAVTAAGYSVSRQQVSIGATIKTLGIFKVRVALHPEVQVQVSVNVARSEEEAESQAAAQFFDPGVAPVAEGEEAPVAEAAAEVTEDEPKKAKAKKAKAEAPAAEGEEAPKKKKAAKAEKSADKAEAKSDDKAEKKSKKK